jgi:polygalacturonase
MSAKLLFDLLNAPRGWLGHWRTHHFVFLAALQIFQTNPSGKVFSPTSFQAESKTGGIQEAIDAASKAGGGRVQIPAGTFILHASPGQPAILLRSSVSLEGAGPDNTILKLEANSRVQPAVMVNQDYTNPDAAEPDHDITLQGFTVDVAASQQVLHDTGLARDISVAGEGNLVFQSNEGIARDSLLLIDPGPNEEIVPILSESAGNFRAFFMHPHARGARVEELVGRLHGLALVGVQNLRIQDVTVRNAPMDGVYLTSTIDGKPHRTYCEKISIQRCNFIACHRNGISIIDAEDVAIANNKFRDIIGDPGGPVDVEPNTPEEHGARIAITNNDVFRCYRGIMVSLPLSAPKPENFKDEEIIGNNIDGILYGWGLSVVRQQAGAIVADNSISGAAGDGIVLIGSSGAHVKDNIIVDPGRCHTVGNCPIKQATAAGIRITDGSSSSNRSIGNTATGNVVTGNKITDNQEPPTMEYGIDFSSIGGGNTIVGNVVSGFDPKHGAAVHVSAEARSNIIANNSRQ